MSKSGKQIQQELALEFEPSGELLELMNEAAEYEAEHGYELRGQKPDTTVSPTEIVEQLLEATVIQSLQKAMKQARAESGKTLAELAEDLGVSRQRVNDIENETNPKLATLSALLDALGYDAMLTLIPRDKDKSVLGSWLTR